MRELELSVLEVFIEIIKKYFEWKDGKGRNFVYMEGTSVYIF